MAGGAARVTLDSHRAIEAAVGLVLLLVPFLLRFGFDDLAEFSGAAIVVCGVIGAAATTLGFSGDRTGTDPSGASHATFDRALLAVTAIAALVFALGSEGEAAVLLGVAALAYLWLVLSTRYTGPG
jgi:hypothetical protein